MKKILLITFSLVIALASFAQESDIEWKLFPSKADSLMAKDTVKTLDRAAVPGKVSINKDERIDRVSKDLAGGASQRPIVKGYRIQIISSSTKATVDSERGRFMSHNTRESSYTDYKAPNFKLLVGNFRTKLDAQRFQQQISDVFPNTIIIADEIELPKLD
ncbi:SPOR domain-containing protein [Flavobacteriales bacterium]|nr:SPOR domain-containing protein [Flavobacteriales bacterium]MDC1370286.1 SPOR domain-containing protein [Flavobacteriales bacterium]